MCTGFESSGDPSEGGYLGSDASFQLHRGEERGRFDDNEGVEEERTWGSPVRGGDRRVPSILGVEIRTPVEKRPSTSVGGHTMGSGGRPACVLSSGEEGEQQSSQKRRGDSRGDVAAASKKQKTKATQTSGGKRKGGEGHVGAASRKRPSSAQIQPVSVPVQQTGPIDVDVAYFLEWKDGVRTKREIPVNPSQVVDIGEWEAGYNECFLDPVHTQLIIDAMTTAYLQASKTYELPTLKLASLGLEKSKPGVCAQRLKPEDWKDELADQYYYYAVVGLHNVAATRTLLGTDVAVRYNFERWPARMVYFSDADFEGYFLVESWRRFCEDALQKTAYNHLWTLTDDKTEQGIRKQNAALRSYFPLAMAGKSVWKMGMEFFEKWETDRLLAPEGAKWIAKKKKVKGVKASVSHIENDKTGRKEVVYNIPIDAPQKKGKKEKESDDWFVQVNEPDPHSWKSMEALTVNEKCRLLKKALNCEVVWVQTGSSALAKQGKLGMQEALDLVKCDRILVRLWNYYQFKYENRPDSDCTRSYPFLRKREAILAQVKSQGLNAALWDGSRKLVGDLSLFRDCPPFMGCEDDKSIKATKKLVLNKKLSIDWKNKVLSVLTGSRSKSMDVALAEGMMKVVELEKAVGITKCHTVVLDLCEPVDITQWTQQTFESLNALLQHLFPSHWTVVAFAPREHDYHFMTSLRHLSVVKAMAGKWVRRPQQKKSFAVGNNLYSVDDRMYILFKGDDLRENTSVVYDARLEAGDATAVGAHVKVTPTDVSEMSFEPCEWPLVIPGRDRKVYKDMERNPAQLAHLLEFVCKKGEGVMFLGKAHKQVVWEALKGGRNVITLEGNSELLQYTLDFLKGAVNSGAHRWELISRTDKPRSVWEPSTGMWFKLSERKRDRIYEFLFLETWPRRDNNPEYIRRREHMLALLDNYHGASRFNAKNFLDRLECTLLSRSRSSGSRGSAGGGPPGPLGGGGGGGSSKGTGEGAASGGSVGTHDQGKTVESGGWVGLLNVADKTTVGASKSAKFADIRTSQNVEPPPLDAAKSVGVRAASTTHWSALPSMTEFAASVGTGRGSSVGVPITGVKYKSAALRTKPPEVHDGELVLRSATGAEVSETGAKTKSAGIRISVSSGATSDDFPSLQGTASVVGDGQPTKFNARLDRGASSVLCNSISASI
ncbi:hypothetical protein CBR_g53600 [Chara braunii]|uniref:Uncharacterized protein n=1 Tax=Chara braunii TaxID=69332 RepID=A0A388MB07_CHABU|nr:hypothetical protein CBR_g53600 [Chara braunii]|eukprot:GBG91748.1 hypothetical protein CBR_g53600 [Chara braunii]